MPSFTSAQALSTFPASALPANGVSIAALLRELYDQSPKSVVTATAATLVTATTVFTVAGGPIKLLELISVCESLCDATASTLQWSADGSATGQAAATFTGASASLANFAAGGMVYCNFAALTTAPVITSTTGVALSSVVTTGIIVQAGIITTTIATGSTTGTFRHYLRYQPLARGVTVTAAY
jgi:hypothetical protein